ncbi:hypothetical protein B0H14DRAFT_2768486 [Mycena olivaceomarginata]|nr:hypothetical protein B0H14DRAFT_2768486 [Mycena olivaceomarginata]
MFLLRPLAAALLVQTTLALVPVGYTPSGLPVFVAPSGSRDVTPTNLKAKRQQTLARRRNQIIFLSANIQVLDANGVPFGNLRAALQYGGSFLPDTGPFWTYAVQLEIPGGGYLQTGQSIDSFIVADPVLDAETEDLGILSPTLEIGWEVPPQLVALQLEEEGFRGLATIPRVLRPPALYWNTSVDPTTDVQVKVDVDGSQDAQVSIIFPRA